ncbi:MAG: hypothetical protein LBH62_08300 [Nitrososphaerota archaeon]|nr:hypothetical protein [Candidatus Termiticorpusculum sp.]MDR0461407.1 hypothetical protein [Nitrososphaerota archaeon]
MVIVAGAYFIITTQNHDNSGHDKSGFVLDENAKNYTGADPISRSGDVPGIKIPGYDTVTLPANTKNVKMILLNPEGNPCYFTFELIVKGETYYLSNLVEPSKCIEDLTLTKPLAKGEYKATLQIRAYSLDENYTVMNGANVEFDLNVI